MAIDTSIYNALMQPPKSAVEYADQFAQRDFEREQRDQQRQQNALAMRAAQQTWADDQAVRAALSGAAPGTQGAIDALQSARNPAALTRAQALQKAQIDAEHVRAQTMRAGGTAPDQVAETEAKQYKLRIEKANKALDDLASFQDPAQAMADLRAKAASEGLPQEQVAEISRQLMGISTQEQWDAWKASTIGRIYGGKWRAEQEWKAKEFGLKAGNELIGPDGSVNQALVGVKSQIGRASAPTTNINTGQRGLDNELKVRGDFRQEPVYKAHQEMQSAYSQIQQALKQASPAGDLAAATKIMKLLDPGSVVRESELGMAMAATGLLDRVQAFVPNILNGTKLTPDQRKQFQELADALYGESVGQFNSKRDEYSQLGGGYGMNTDRLLGPKATGAKPAAAGRNAGTDIPDDIRALLQKHGGK